MYIFLNLKERYAVFQDNKNVKTKKISKEEYL